MVLDCHIHILDPRRNYGTFRKRLQEAGMDGGVVISLPPACFPELAVPQPPAARLDNLLAWCRGNRQLFPFYWIDPVEADAETQVTQAVNAGVKGFKVICDHFPPGAEPALRTYAAIAKTGRPILFHSGILWDGKPSSPYNRPAEFEPLLCVPGLRFAMAHISWPWCDELLAVYGKFLNARTRGRGCDVELFIDLTPGTPPIYRREALTKLFTIGYDVAGNVLFGSDGLTSDYRGDWVRAWIERDNGIYRELALSETTLAGIYAGNLLRFITGDKSGRVKRLPRPGE